MEVVKCFNCGNDFEKKKSNHLYCSDSCRKKWHRLKESISISDDKELSQFERGAKIMGLLKPTATTYLDNSCLGFTMTSICGRKNVTIYLNEKGEMYDFETKSKPIVFSGPSRNPLFR